MDLSKKLISSIVAAVLIAGPLPASARENEPSAGEMAADIVIARPLGVVVTALGTAAFVVSLPFSALGGNVEKAGQKLVVDPAKATFVRCLGCTTAGRYSDPDRAK